MRLMVSLIIGAMIVGVATNVMFAEPEEIDIGKQMEIIKKGSMESLKEDFLQEQRVEKMKQDVKNYKKEQTGKEEQKNKEIYLGTFKATGYDLTVGSTGKSESHPAYGITASGESLKGHTWDSARAIAVDTSIIPLGSTVRLEFSGQWHYMSGEYRALDTGSAINGYIVDVFFGDSGDTVTEQIVWDFGNKQTVEIYLLK